MKSVKEINDFREKYRNMPISVYGIQDLHQFIFETLIGITERIEAHVAIDDATVKAIERQAMIRTLEWVLMDTTWGACAHTRTRYEILDAHDRLKDGGDLNA